jgi:hypothetical protein
VCKFSPLCLKHCEIHFLTILLLLCTSQSDVT